MLPWKAVMTIVTYHDPLNRAALFSFSFGEFGKKIGFAASELYHCYSHSWSCWYNKLAHIGKGSLLAFIKSLLQAHSFCFLL